MPVLMLRTARSNYQGIDGVDVAIRYLNLDNSIVMRPSSDVPQLFQSMYRRYWIDLAV